MTKKQTRNEIIDIAKGIAIYLVVLGHLQLKSYNASIVLIASCHMPVFFFISGLFFKKSVDKYSAKEFMLNKIRTLIIPYLIWSAIAFAENMLMLIIQGKQEEWIDEAYDIFINSRSVWFLIVLFCTNLFVYTIFRFTNQRKSLFIIVCLVIWIITMMYGKIIIFSLYKFQWLFPYYLLGILFSYQNRFFSYLRKITDRNIGKQCAVAISCIAMYIICTLYLCKENLFEEFYSNYQLKISHSLYYALFYMIGFIGIIAIIELAGILMQTSKIGKIFESCGLYSIDIYVIHMFFVVVIKKVLGMEIVPLWAKSELILMFYAFGIAVAISVMVGKWLRRNNLYRLSVGGR